MGYKSIIQILLILAIISTICISIMKPKMHKPVMVLNSQFSVEHDDGINIDEQNIAVMVQDAQVNTESGVGIKNEEGGINFVEPKIEDIAPVSFKNTQTSNIKNTGNIGNIKTQPVKNAGIKNNSTNVKTTPAKTVNNAVKPAQTKVNTTSVANKPSTTNTQSPKIDLNKIVNNNQKVVNTPTPTQTAPVSSAPVMITKPAPAQPVQTTKPQTTQTQAAAQTQQTPAIRVNSGTTSTPSPVTAKAETKPVTLTAQEEEIAWNKWRSNLNNQIMKDAKSKLPMMPNGTVFKYKFTVDKYGKISNVQTYSETSAYTPYAIQYIMPVIRSYQGRSILNFPTGSNRVTTTVTAAWVISSNLKVSTPEDYHDIEKVKK